MLRNHAQSLEFKNSHDILHFCFFSSQQCWENAIGQEIYRFVIIDFLLVGCAGALYHLNRFLIYKYVWPKVGLPEFNISRASLGLIFNQTLLWIGLFFSPILGVVLIVKMIIVFYLKVCYKYFAFVPKIHSFLKFMLRRKLF